MRLSKSGLNGCLLHTHGLALVMMFLCVVVGVILLGHCPEAQTTTLERDGDSGYFLSPNYPQKYPKNENLTYTGHLTTAGPLMLRVHLDIDLERSGDTCPDYVKIQNLHYCGSGTGTYDIRINGTEFVMIFYSDSTITKNGFNVSYSVIEVITTEAPAATTLNAADATTTILYDVTTTPAASAEVYVTSLSPVVDETGGTTDIVTSRTTLTQTTPAVHQQVTTDVTETVSQVSETGSSVTTQLSTDGIPVTSQADVPSTASSQTTQGTDSAEANLPSDDDSTQATDLTSNGVLTGESTREVDVTGVGQSTTDTAQGASILESTTQKPTTAGFTTSGELEEETTQSQGITASTSAGQSSEETVPNQSTTGPLDESSTLNQHAADLTTGDTLAGGSTLAQHATMSTLLEASSASGLLNRNTSNQDITDSTTIGELSGDTISTQSISTTVGQLSGNTSVIQHATNSTTAGQLNSDNTSPEYTTGSPVNQPPYSTTLSEDTTDSMANGHLSHTTSSAQGTSTANQRTASVTDTTARQKIAVKGKTTAKATVSPAKSPKSCSCVHVEKGQQNNTGLSAQEQQELALMVESLTVPKDNMSATLRRYTSAPDPRSSSRAMGMVGISICALPILFMLITDVMGVCARKPKPGARYGK